MLKAVLDTNILLSALIWRGAPYHCLLSAQAGFFELIISEEILTELSRVLVKKFKIEKPKVEEFITLVRSTGRLVSIAESIRVIADDPSDDKVIETAVSAHADFIVTGDQHLLKLKKYQNFRIIKAAEFLQEILKLKTY